MCVCTNVETGARKFRLNLDDKIFWGFYSQLQ